MENYNLFFYFIMSFPCVYFLFCVILQKSFKIKDVASLHLSERKYSSLCNVLRIKSVNKSYKFSKKIVAIIKYYYLCCKYGKRTQTKQKNNHNEYENFYFA